MLDYETIQNLVWSPHMPSCLRKVVYHFCMVAEHRYCRGEDATDGNNDHGHGWAD